MLAVPSALIASTGPGAPGIAFTNPVKNIAPQWKASPSSPIPLITASPTDSRSARLPSGSPPSTSRAHMARATTAIRLSTKLVDTS